MDYWYITVLLSAGSIHSREPTLPGVIDTGIGHQQMLRLLDAQDLVIQQHLYGLPPEPLIDVEAKVVEANLTLLAHLAGLLAEAEDPPEAGRFDHAAPGVAQDDLW